jgi:hypothetical protein
MEGNLLAEGRTDIVQQGWIRRIPEFGAQPIEEGIECFRGKLRG